MVRPSSCRGQPRRRVSPSRRDCHRSACRWLAAALTVIVHRVSSGLLGVDEPLPGPRELERKSRHGAGGRLSYPGGIGLSTLSIVGGSATVLLRAVLAWPAGPARPDRTGRSGLR